MDVYETRLLTVVVIGVMLYILALAGVALALAIR